jgi:hypothetical protein
MRHGELNGIASGEFEEGLEASAGARTLLVEAEQG